MEWPFRYEVRAQWRDLDAAGHVNNAVYFTYMEAARLDAFFAATGGSRWQDLDIILARIACDFLSPATMNDRLVVEVTPTRVGETSFAFAYDVRDAATGRAVARGESVQVMFDYAKNAKKPLPPALRKALESGIRTG